MIDLIKQFLNWVVYLPIFNPLLGAIAWGMLRTTPKSVRSYVVNGFGTFWAEVLPIVLLIVVALVIIRIFGLLNPGNFGHGADKQPKIKNSPLKGKNIIFPGSSVTKGFTAWGTSLVDMIVARTDAKVVKEAVSGTTLVDNSEKSYISRLKKLDKKQPCDVFVYQLSTNDATKKKPLGSVSKDTNLASFDTKTVCGAIEYIIAYAKETWNCSMVFYTSPEYASLAYASMVDALAQIAKKWDIQVVDLWNDKEINEKTTRA